MRAIVQFSVRVGASAAEALARALRPDNVETPKVRVECSRSGGELLCKIESESLLVAKNTLNDLLACLSSALESIERVESFKK